MEERRRRSRSKKRQRRRRRRRKRRRRNKREKENMKGRGARNMKYEVETIMLIIVSKISGTGRLCKYAFWKQHWLIF